jgi:tetratricopeptide (TPR) repeat protein
LDQVEEACAVYEKGAKLCGEAGDDGSRYAFLQAWADLSLDEGDLKQATSLWKQALAIGEEYEDTVRMAEALRALAGLESEREAFAKAKVTYERALDLAKGNNDLEAQTGILLELGEVLVELKDWRGAAHAFEEARLRGEEEELPSAVAQAWLQLGNLSREAEEPEVARTRYLEAITHYEAAADEEGLAVARHRLGSVLAELGDPAAARPLLELALTGYQVVGDPLGVAVVTRALQSLP